MQVLFVEIDSSISFSLLPYKERELAAQKLLAEKFTTRLFRKEKQQVDVPYYVSAYFVLFITV